MTIKLITGDCRDVLKTLPDESVHCVITSPPYWGLRDYGVDGQLGLEQSLGEHVQTMVEVFREVRRVLRKDGTLWLNYGDSYAASVNGRSAADTKALGEDDRTFRDKPFSTIGPIYDANHRPNGSNRSRGLNSGSKQVGDEAVPLGRIVAGGYLKPKDLCGIPWRVAFALQEDGWWLRQDIIWSKPNPMPESVRDRCTKAHEYLFLMAKNERYYFDQEAISEPVTDSTIERLSQPTLEQQEGSWRVPGKTNGAMKAKGPRFGTPGGKAEIEYGSMVSGEVYVSNGKRNKRSVWEVTTQPFSEAHSATFPPALIEPCIRAGTSEKGCCGKCGAPWRRETETDYRRHENWFGNKQDARHSRGKAGNGYNEPIATRTTGWSPSCKCDADIGPCVVLDPFGGAGTTALVADRLQRNAILIELNPAYVEIARKRIDGDAPLFTQVETDARGGGVAR